MSLKDVTQHELDRRNFLRLSGIAGAGVVLVACGAPAGGGEAAAPAAEGGEAAAPAAGRQHWPMFPARRRWSSCSAATAPSTLTSAWAIPMPPAATHQIGGAAMLEPLYFWSAYADEEIPWLATGYEYNDDFTELTVNIREGVEWSDGEAFRRQ